MDLSDLCVLFDGSTQKDINKAQTAPTVVRLNLSL